MAYTEIPSVVTGQTYSAGNYNTYLKANIEYLKANVDTVLAGSWPVGCIYVSTVATNPATVMGFGTWEAFGAGRTLVGVGTSDAVYAAAATGGESTHTLTTPEMPAHAHTHNAHNHGADPHGHAVDGWMNMKEGTGGQVPVYQRGLGAISTGATTANVQAATSSEQNAGGGGAHNNMPPYVVVYFWKRTA